MHVVLLFLCGDLKCTEYNNYLQCSPIKLIIFVTLGHQRKFIHVKNNHTKYSCDLIWVTYGISFAMCTDMEFCLDCNMQLLSYLVQYS